MFDPLASWGPSGPQPVSPLNFFDLTQYLAQLIERQYEIKILPEFYTWTQEGLDGDRVLIYATPKDAVDKLTQLKLRIPYVDLVDLLEPLLIQRVFDFSGEITAERIVARINAIAGVPLLNAAYFQFSSLDITGTATVTMTPTIANLISVGELQVNIRQVNTDIDEEHGLSSYPFTDQADWNIEMCLRGSNVPLEASDTTGQRRVYGDGSYVEVIDTDTFEVRRGMMANYWLRLTLPGRKFAQDFEGTPANLLIELVTLNKGEINLHLDSVQPVTLLATAEQIGEVVGVNIDQYVGFNFNPIELGVLGESDHTQIAQIRVRLIKEP